MHALVLLLAFAATSASTPAAQPAVKPLPQGKMQIDYQTLHCAGCARQIARNLYKTPGVMKVQTNMKQNRVWVTVQRNKKVSLAQVWRAAHVKDAKPATLQVGAKLYAAKDFQPKTQTAKHGTQAGDQASVKAR